MAFRRSELEEKGMFELRNIARKAPGEVGVEIKAWSSKTREELINDILNAYGEVVASSSKKHVINDKPKEEIIDETPSGIIVEEELTGTDEVKGVSVLSNITTELDDDEEEPVHETVPDEDESQDYADEGIHESDIGKVVIDYNEAGYKRSAAIRDMLQKGFHIDSICNIIVRQYPNQEYKKVRLAVGVEKHKLRKKGLID